MHSISSRRRLALAFAAVVGSGSLLSCASGTATEEAAGDICVDVGTENCIAVEQPIKMAYFAFGLGTSWGAANAEEVKAYAKSEGVDLTVFDPAFDATKQFQQIQTALSSRRYNAFAVVAIDNDLVCKALTESTVRQGIVTVAVNQPLCGRGAGEDTSTYAAPGTLTFIGSTNVELGLSEWLDEAARQNAGRQKVALITGVETDGISKKLDGLLPAFKDAHPEWDFVAVNRTDYSSAKGYAAAQDILNAHPDTTLILSVFSDLTTGAANAIDQAGLTGDVKLVDYNGNAATVEMVCDGALQFTVPEVPRTSARMAVDSIVTAFAGDAVERFQRTPQPALTAAESCDYKAEY